MTGWNVGTVVQPAFSPAAAVFMVGNMVPSWMQTFKGEIAEIRIYDAYRNVRQRR